MKRVLWAVLGLGAGLGFGWILVNQPPASNPRFDPLPSDRLIPRISARGAFKDGREEAGFKLASVNGVPGLDGPCTDELMIVVHGFNNSREKALNRFGVAKQSLERAGYRGVVAGFTWDADTQRDPYSMTGYHQGRDQSRVSGKLLAEALLDIRSKCPGAKVRLIGYSMGARVALESLIHLPPGSVASVHLVGAALDNEEVELGKRYGEAIGRSAGVVINYHSPEDSKLGLFYWAKEGDQALGKADVEHRERAPKNFESRNVAAELPEIDSAGKPVKSGKLGRNHSGYLGTRDNEGKLSDDGAMDVVVRDISQFK